MNETFVFLDSTRSVCQSIQHSIIRTYASNRHLQISFYGAEFRGYEHRHMQLHQYLLNSNIQHFLFFTFDQFFTDQGYDLELISLGLERSVSFYFAVESIDITSHADFSKIRKESIVSAINRLSPFRPSLLN